MIRAPFSDARSMASRARTIESSGVRGNWRFASASRNRSMNLPRFPFVGFNNRLAARTPRRGHWKFCRLRSTPPQVHRPMSTRQSLDRGAPRHSVRTRIATVTMVGAALIAVVFARQPTSLAARSAEPTFAEDVAPILYKNCTTCHHPGGLGPFSLLDYEGAKAKTDEMHDAVEARYMPPWHAEGAHGVFRNDRRLSDAERQTILRWIESGSKSGDLSKAPPKPEY